MKKKIRKSEAILKQVKTLIHELPDEMDTMKTCLYNLIVDVEYIHDDMKELLNELQEFIDKNSKNYNITIVVSDWKECGEFNGDDPKPIFNLTLTEKTLI